MQYLEQCILAYGDALYRFCCNQTDSRYEAEELYQDTLLCVLEDPKKFQKVKNPKCYILGVALHLEKNKRRKRTRRDRIAPVISGNVRTGEGGEIDVLVFAAGSGDETEKKVLHHELQQRLREVIKVLPETYQAVLSLYYGNELSVKEIAGVMKTPEATVKSRLFQARKRLKKVLEGEGYDGTEFG